jgi:hemoglobin
MTKPYDALGGMPFFVSLAHAWHERCLADEIVSHAFSHGFHPDHTNRLAAYWAEALGGPKTYSTSHGSETEVVRMHSGNGEHKEMDDRAIACFAAALDDVKLADAALRATLTDYFAWAMHAMMKYHSGQAVPDDLPFGYYER